MLKSDIYGSTDTGKLLLHMGRHQYDTTDPTTIPPAASPTTTPMVALPNTEV
jgi:hypothetical protein